MHDHFIMVLSACCQAVEGLDYKDRMLHLGIGEIHWS